MPLDINFRYAAMTGVTQPPCVAVVRFNRIRPGWFIIMDLFAVSVLRHWLRGGLLDTDRSRNYRRDRHESGKTRGNGGKRSHSRVHNDFLTYTGPATESELGEHWHADGGRRWSWLHNGHEANGWIELGTGGALRTSFNSANGAGKWELRYTGELVVTFGKCHHVLRLLPTRPGDAPEFRMTERIMRDGSAPRSQRPARTRGRLEKH